ncbi:MAG: hypothetical protein O2820_00145 [Planctomycetota bacterium]|nr:hypothetical protein [Planctomycetota bacterium]MDA1247605.1 hypothetical protein [Planctomycetota bacterium]
MTRPEEKTVSHCPTDSSDSPTSNGVCPVCAGRLIDIRHKLQCERCHTICETCCEGGRG